MTALFIQLPTDPNVTQPSILILTLTPILNFAMEHIEDSATLNRWGSGTCATELEPIPLGPAFVEKKVEVSRTESMAKLFGPSVSSAMRYRYPFSDGEEVHDIRLFTAAFIATAAQTHRKSAFKAREMGLDPDSPILAEDILSKYLSESWPSPNLEVEVSRFYMKLCEVLDVETPQDRREKQMDPLFATKPSPPCNSLIGSSVLEIALQYILAGTLISEEWWQWINAKRGGFSIGVSTSPGEDDHVQKMVGNANEYEKRIIWLGVVFANILDILPTFTTDGLAYLVPRAPYDERTLYGRLKNRRVQFDLHAVLANVVQHCARLVEAPHSLDLCNEWLEVVPN